MLYLPQPYPDEIVGSLLVRACRHTGLPFKRLVQYLAGVRGRSYASFLLTPFIDQLGREAGVDPDELILGHTVFPYVTAFMTAEAAGRLRALLLSDRSEIRTNLAPYTQSVTQGLAFRRICPQCAIEDLEKYGESYWHREHLLPAVYICRFHREPLIETVIPVRYGMRHWTYALPHEITGTPLSLVPSPEIQSDIAARSAALLTNPHIERDWLGQYRALAFQKGFGKQQFINGTQMARDLLAFYGPSFLEEAGCRLTPGAKGFWPPLMVRVGTHEPFSPPKHILLQTFLQHCSDAPKTVSYNLPGPKPVDRPSLDADCVQKMRAVLDESDVNAKYSVTKLLTEVGYWSQFRHERQAFPDTVAFLSKFKRSERSIRQTRQTDDEHHQGKQN
ncbi:MAG: TnsD family transposase [Rhizobium sp.]|nr:TnsD family transposase [Rhizobium sp.]